MYFGSFLNSVIGKREFFSEWIVGIGCISQFSLFHFPFKINFSSKYRELNFS